VKGQNRLFHYHPEAWVKRSAARFREVGGSIVRSASFAEGGTLSLHLHKVPNRSNEVSPRTFEMALVYSERAGLYATVFCSLFDCAPVRTEIFHGFPQCFQTITGIIP
jgi:hypothetical protein